MSQTIIVRRDTSANWIAAGNPVLAAGELGYDTDLKLTKMGDGVTAWNLLPSISAGSEPDLSSYVTEGELATLLDGYVAEVDAASIISSSNLVKNPSAEVSFLDYVTFGAGVSAPTQSPVALVGDSSFRLTGATTAGPTTWWEWELETIPSFFVGKPLSFSLKTSTSASDIFEVIVYNTTDNVAIISSYVPIPAGMYEARSFFIPEAGKTYKLRITQADDGAATCDIDDVFVGDEPVRYGQAMTDWVSFTPAVTGVSGFSYADGKWRRVGDSMQITFRLLKDGNAPAGGTTAYFGIPAGYSVDNSKLNYLANNSTSIIGQGNLAASGTTYGYNLTAVWYSTPSVICFEKPTTSSLLTGSDITANSFVSGFVTVPIVGWSSNIQLADRALEEFASNSNATNTATDTTSFAYGVTGSNIPNGAVGTEYARRIKFQTAIQSTDSLILEVDQGAGQWINYGDRLYAKTAQGAKTYGAEVSIIDTLTANVVFLHGGYAATGGSYAADGSPWSSITTWKWRVRKVSGGAQVGFPVSSQNIFNPYFLHEECAVADGTAITTTPLVLHTFTAPYSGIYDIRSICFAGHDTANNTVINFRMNNNGSFVRELDTKNATIESSGTFQGSVLVSAIKGDVITLVIVLGYTVGGSCALQNIVAGNYAKKGTMTVKYCGQA